MQGADGKPFLVAVLAQATPTTATPRRLTVWVCNQLSASNDGSTDEHSWIPCGWFDGTEVTFFSSLEGLLTHASEGCWVVRKMRSVVCARGGG